MTSATSGPWLSAGPASGRTVAEDHARMRGHPQTFFDQAMGNRRRRCLFLRRAGLQALPPRRVEPQRGGVRHMAKCSAV
jgi:hypothetical protein